MAEKLCDLTGGEIRSAPLAALLVEALRLRATGELRVDAHGGSSRVYLRGGQPCGAQVFFGFRPLGQFLLEQGWIDIEALELSLAAVANGRKQGEALVELGFLSEEKMRRGLALHHQGHIRNLAVVTEGIYSFQSMQELPAWTDELRLSAHRAIVDALAAPPGRAVSQKILRWIPTGLGVRLRTGWERFTAHFQLDATEEMFVASLERTTAIEVAVAGSLLAENHALALLACLQLMEILVPAPLGGEASWATPGPALFATPGPLSMAGGLERKVPPAAPAAAVPPGAMPSAGARALEVDFGPSLGDRIAGARDSFEEPLELEIVEADAARDELPIANGRQNSVAWESSRPAPIYHAMPAAERVETDPDATRVAAPPPELLAPPPFFRGKTGLDAAELAGLEEQQRRAQDETRQLRIEDDIRATRAREEALLRPAPAFQSDPAEAKERRARLLQRAFGNILGPEAMRRRGLDSISAGPPQQEQPQEASGEDGVISWDSLPPPGDPAFERFVRERLGRAESDDHYARLGIRRGAGREEVKQAFFGAAKRFHPDRIPSAVAHLAPHLKELFAAITESYQHLQDDERRKAYHAELVRPVVRAATGPAQQAIQRLEAEAAEAARKRDFAAVEQLLTQALRLEDRPDLRAHCLWARQSAKPHEAGQVRIELERLVENQPACAIGHYYLGVLARVAGDTGRAELCFKKTLELTPDHREARQELRLIELRKAASPHLRKR